MDKRHLATVCVATAGCFALSLLVTRLSPFSSNSGTQAQAASSVAPLPAPGEPADRSPETYHGSVLFSSSAAMLGSLGVTPYPQDKVYAFPDPSLGIGSTLRVYRAQPVTVTDAGRLAVSSRTWAATVGEVLAEQGVEVGENDKVSPGMGEAVALGERPFNISVTRVAETQLSVNSDIPFGTTYKDDPTQMQGQTSVAQAGKKGVLKKTYKVRRENGTEVSRVLLSSAVAVPPVDQVILRGTKPKVVKLSAGQYASYLNAAAEKYGVPAAGLQKVMMCESGGNVNSVNPGGPYYGLFQFDRQTWVSTAYGGSDILDPQAQIMAAASLWQWRGAKWPACSRGT